MILTDGELKALNAAKEGRLTQSGGQFFVSRGNGNPQPLKKEVTRSLSRHGLIDEFGGLTTKGKGMLKPK